jgi:hypothetical protein
MGGHSTIRHTMQIECRLRAASEGMWQAIGYQDRRRKRLTGSMPISPTAGFGGKDRQQTHRQACISDLPPDAEHHPRQADARISRYPKVTGGKLTKIGRMVGGKPTWIGQRQVGLPEDLTLLL